jgi:TetR/AcrR family transcriptional regulator, transcriptional repressor for nem operon
MMIMHCCLEVHLKTLEVRVMRYPAAETAKKHKNIIREAARLFRERGFTGVSVAEIMQATGLTHGPFYNHFPSKEDLMAKSLEHGMQSSLASIEQVGNSAKKTAEYLDRYLSTAHRDAPGKGCTMAALAADIRQQPEVRRTFTAHVKAIIEKMASNFSWRSKRPARGDSIRMLSTMVGALILARAVDDEAFSKEILREARRGLA